MKVSFDEVQYGKFGKCMVLSNGEIELYITMQFGPRVIRFGFINDVNEFCENFDQEIDVNGEMYRFRGGHRLWHSPEVMPRTYIPDNNPPEFKKTDRGVIVTAPKEPYVQMVKEMEISFTESGSVKVTHRLTNKNAWDVKTALWAITVMANSGCEIIPMKNKETGYLANRAVAVWPYTKMNDERLYWGDEFITLKQNPEETRALKIGINNENGYAAYYNHNHIFAIKLNHFEDAEYPDYGMSYETYTNNIILEMETLSPFYTIAPGETKCHEEEWFLKKCSDLNVKDENSIKKTLSFLG